MTRPVGAVTCRVPPEISYLADDKRFFKNLAMKFRLSDPKEIWFQDNMALDGGTS